MKLLKMRPATAESPGAGIAKRAEARTAEFFKFVASSLKSFWRLASRQVRSKRKALVVSETAALGERRFVSVVQFEYQRFLIGSSPASVTLLARLPDTGTESKKSGEKTGNAGERPGGLGETS
jgi:flagellar biogenesis protein FliO